MQPLAAKKASKKAVWLYPPRILVDIRWQIWPHSHVHIEPACLLCAVECALIAVSQSRNLPGNQGPSDGGATQLLVGESAMTEEGPSVRDYLEFGRLLGERPETVKQRLEVAGGYPASDDDAEDYLQQCVRLTDVS